MKLRIIDFKIGFQKNGLNIFLFCHPCGMDLKYIIIKLHTSINKGCTGITNNDIWTELWWVSGLMCQSIINPILKVVGSNPRL